MNKHLVTGVIVGAIFAIPITWVATLDTIADGNMLEILATTVFGLAAGLCIGALIAANFAMLALEENEHEPAHRQVEAHANL